jgi:putative PIN family toxin of toxin-antitoxin system
VRAVLDVNVVISALLSRSGAPARIVRAWLDGYFELVVSAALLAELERSLDYPKLQRTITTTEREELITLLRMSAITAEDPAVPPPVMSPDRDDDYLIALAASQDAMLVSGDRHLLELEARGRTIHSPAEFLTLLEG